MTREERGLDTLLIRQLHNVSMHQHYYFSNHLPYTYITSKPVYLVIKFKVPELPKLNSNETIHFLDSAFHSIIVALFIYSLLILAKISFLLSFTLLWQMHSLASLMFQFINPPLPPSLKTDTWALTNHILKKNKVKNIRILDLHTFIYFSNIIKASFLMFHCLRAN